MNLRLPLTDSIGAVLDLIEGADKGGLYCPCSSEISSTIKASMSGWSDVVDQIIIIHQLHIPSVKDIPNQVKNRILDWALKLERAGIHGENHTFTQAERTMAEQLTFNDYSTTVQTGSVQGGLQVASPHAAQTVTIQHNEVEQTIHKITEAVDASAELDEIDKRDIRLSLSFVQQAANETSEKSKSKIAEKLASIASAVESCAKLAPVVNPLIAYLKTKFHLA